MGKRKKTNTLPPQRVRAGRHVNIRVNELEPGLYDAKITGNVSLGRVMDRVMRAGLQAVAGKQANLPWNPLEQAQFTDDEAKDAPNSTLWINDLYMVVCTDFFDESGITHLSIKRNDKIRVREWRHLQQIKNELCGPEREAVELFPAESRLVDAADQYHLWVLPEGERFPFGYQDRLVASPDQVAEWNRRNGKRGLVVDQTPWAPGLTTGHMP